MRLVSAVLLPLLVAAPALAQNYPVAVGAGISPCRQYQHLHHEDPAMVDAYFAWAEGYLSGLDDRYIGAGTPVNVLPPNMSTEQQKTFLDAFCDAHPDAPYMQGVIALFERMRIAQGIAPAPGAAPGTARGAALGTAPALPAAPARR